MENRATICYGDLTMASKERLPGEQDLGELAIALGERFIQRQDLYARQLEDGRLYDNATPAELEMERLMLGLRTDRGVSVQSLHCPDGDINAILEAGLGVVHEGRLRLTARGFLVLNEVVLRVAR